MRTISRNATRVDGTGAPGRPADVAVEGARLAAVAPPGTLTGDETIEAEGRVLAPGFIDVHTHDDRILLSAPDHPAKTSQGVTTVVVGNCGVSLAPLQGRPIPPPLDLIGDDGWYRFARFADYLAALDAAPAAVNAAFLVGHMTLRAGDMDSFDRPATPAEIAAMRARLEEGLAAGAIGFSTGLFYAPSQAAPTDEVVALASALKPAGGLYCTHMRNEADDVMTSLEETFEIGRRSGVPVVISHHKVVGQPNFGRTKETLARIEAARLEQTVGLDVYPYHASSTVLREILIPVARRILVTWSKARPDLAGRDLADIAREMGCDQVEAARRLQPAGAIYWTMDEADVQRVLKYPHAMIGSDGLPHDEFPHPRLWGSFPRVLGHYARELGLFGLEEAVRRMTSLPAATFGLTGRGVVRQGNHADLVLFDPGTVIDRATFDDPMRPADGIIWVMVNGQMVWRDGRPTGARPGRALRRQDLQAEAKAIS